MTSKELRSEFLKFFEKKGHTKVESSSLIPTDPSVLLTSAGMQQFKPYYLGEASPYGAQVVSCQKCFRTSDIEEVGDDSHLTFLEMLGNFSFGGYFKKEAIEMAYEFLFTKLKLPLECAVFTIFQGDENVPEDRESAEIWEGLGIPESQIKKCGRDDNFWGPTGEEGPCGPTTEIHINGIEVWNLVFNEYNCDKNKKLTPLKQKGVDTGMGLERLAMVSQGKNNVFETDLFEPILREISGDEKSKRIIADHIRGAVFLIAEGILPSNVERGYILRRVLRRALAKGKTLQTDKSFLIPLAKKAIEAYKDIYPELEMKEAEILTIIQNEAEKFEKALIVGQKITGKLETPIRKFFKGYLSGKAMGGKTISNSKFDLSTFDIPEVKGKDLFLISSTYGYPIDNCFEEINAIIVLILEADGLNNTGKFNIKETYFGKRLTKEFNEESQKHKEFSRAGVKKKFGGVGKEATREATKLHTVTHLLHAALRKVLGEHVQQMGSDITPQRLRFDFSHSQKMTQEEIKQVEDLVNEKIKEGLEVKKEEMSYQEAIKSGALAFFKEKYPEKVTVYSVEGFSKEICAGPHVKRTSEIGGINIQKEESSGAGVRRIRAILQ